jgi:hypothetical protein
MKTLFHKLSPLVCIMAVSCVGMVSCKKEDLKKEDINRPLSAATALTPEQFDESLAYRWAPVHFQDVDVTGTYSLSGKSDYITAINFDNDWIATNNWNNIANATPAAHAYYSVVETSTHWFIVYAFYHPRDWTDDPFGYYLDQHENDVEGCMSIIKKDGTTYGTFLGMVTVSHSDFFAFTPSGSPLQNNHETIDGTVTMETYENVPHPMTAEEAKGHAMKAYPYYNIVGDGIKYYPSSDHIAGVPTGANDRNVKYKLVNIFEAGGLWDQRFNTQLLNAATTGFLSTVGSGGANTPWGWNDGDDGDVQSGEMATDPAKLTNIYFKNLGTFDLNYISNKYKGIN